MRRRRRGVEGGRGRKRVVMGSKRNDVTSCWPSWRFVITVVVVLVIPTRCPPSACPSLSLSYNKPRPCHPRCNHRHPFPPSLFTPFHNHLQLVFIKNTKKRESHLPSSHPTKPPQATQRKKNQYEAQRCRRLGRFRCRWTGCQRKDLWQGAFCQ